MKHYIYSTALYFLGLLLPTSASLQAQQTIEVPSLVRYGLFGHYGMNQHTVNFKEIVPSCCNAFFPNVNNAGIHLGALAEFPVVGNLGISFRLGFSPLTSRFMSEGKVLTIINSNTPYTIPVQFHLETRTGSIDAEPSITFRPIQDLSLYAGVRGALFIQSQFRQYEQLLSETVTYKGGSSIRADETGSIPSFNGFVPFLSAGISYEIGLSPTVMIAPEVFYSYKLGSLLKDKVWEINTLRFGLSIRLSPGMRTVTREQAQRSEPPPQPTRQVTQNPVQPTQPVQPDKGAPKIPTMDEKREDPKREDPLPPPPAARIVSITGFSASSTGIQQVTSPIVRVEEFSASSSRYILPSVYFDELSTDIAQRYKKLKPSEKNKFLLENLATQGLLDNYYQILNIIGKRLGLSPRSKITLTGFADAGKEKSDIQLAQRRTETIKKYLKDVWNIDEKRVGVKTGVPPIGSSGEPNSDNSPENQRRVEIHSDSPELMDDLRFDYIQRLAQPKLLKMKLDIDAPAGLKQWKLEAIEADSVRVRTLKTFRGTTSFPETLDWNVAASPQDTLPESSRDVALRLEAQDKTNRSVRSPFSFVPMEVITINAKRKSRKPDEKIESFTVPLFADNSVVQRTLKKIQAKVSPESNVVITGYSDPRDSETETLANAKQRAQTVAKLLNLTNSTTILAAPAPLYDNAVPEGKHYNRTVQVEIRTPVK